MSVKSAHRALADFLSYGRLVGDHRPWPRVIVITDTWMKMLDRLEAGHWTLLGLWGEPNMVHAALYDSENSEAAVASLSVVGGRYPSVSRVVPAAIRLERMLVETVGLIPEGMPDVRPWLDHGCWPVRHPLGGKRETQISAPKVESDGDSAFPMPKDYDFLSAEGESLHQIPVGPVHAGIIEPGHFRFTASGETVVRLEERLGYVHKGVERLLSGATIARGAQLAGRVSGDSTVSYAVAYARAVEAALGLEVPARAHWLRALMMELERVANHFGDVGAICNDAAFSLLQAHCAVLRELTLRASYACFGHRLMMDCVVPGGVAREIAQDESKGLFAQVGEWRRAFRRVSALYELTPSLQDRTVNTGVLRSGLAARFGAGGYVGRASGRGFDARRSLGYPPYPSLDFGIPLRHDGDVNARVWIRIREVRQSLRMIRQILRGMPEGPTRVDLPTRGAGEGVALVEGFRGDILSWVRLRDDGTIDRAHFRDPSWFQWPLLEAAIEGNIVADFPLCNKSFNCSYSGHDL
ncbi:Hydrogenase expression protein HypE [Azospirillaceae bacterium]